MKHIEAFCAEVLKEIPRATGGERRAIQRELTDHILDHRDALMEYGAQEEEALRRAVESMGEATEIGRAWNATLSPFWLWLGRGCLAAFLLIAFLLSGRVVWRLETMAGAAMIGRAEVVRDKLDEVDGFDLIWQNDPGIKMDLGGHVIRVHRVTLWENDYDACRLQIYSITYPKNPTHYPLNYNALMFGLKAADVIPTGGSGADDIRQGYSECRYTYKIDKGKPYVDVSLDYNGQSTAARIELDWGGAKG